MRQNRTLATTRAILVALVALAVCAMGVGRRHAVTALPVPASAVVAPLPVAAPVPSGDAPSVPLASGSDAAPAVAAPSLLFVENVGQWPADDGEVAPRFVVRGVGGGMWLTPDGVWLAVAEPLDAPPDRAAARTEPRRRAMIRLSFVGANPAPRLEPFAPQATRVSYFFGRDPDRWRSAVPVWGGVRYVDLEPGLDLVLSAAGGRWDWRLEANGSAGATPLADVTLRVEGCEEVALADGLLRLDTARGTAALPLVAMARDEGLAGVALLTTRVRSVGQQAFDVASPWRPIPDGATAPGLADAPTTQLWGTYMGGSGEDYAWPWPPTLTAASM